VEAMSTTHRIKEIRESTIINGRKLSGRKIASELGISPQYYYEIERGEKNLSAEMASKLADLFGVTVDYLIGKNGEQQKTSVDNAQRFKEDFTELTDDEVIEKFDLRIDGQRLTPEEAKFVIQNLRSFREFRK
jgi:transcriptional regulator with XRE-family HTH domain